MGKNRNAAFQDNSTPRGYVVAFAIAYYLQQNCLLSHVRGTLLFLLIFFILFYRIVHLHLKAHTERRN